MVWALRGELTKTLQALQSVKLSCKNFLLDRLVDPANLEAPGTASTLRVDGRGDGKTLVATGVQLLGVWHEEHALRRQ